MLRLFFFMITITFVFSLKQKMIVNWGTPRSLDVFEVQEGVTWENCLQNCLTTEDCMMVFSDPTGICRSCKLQNSISIPDVLKSTKDDGGMVGFKVKVNENTDECPTGDNAPTFDGVNAEGDASTTTDIGRIQNYTITFTGSEWKFETFSMARCRSSFAFYRRSTIDWCFAVGSIDGANTSWSRREAVCAKYSSELVTVTPSGVASADEVDGVVYQLNSLKNRNKQQTFATFVDLKRTDSCQLTPTSSICMSIEGFTTVDKSVTNLNGYQFITDVSAGAEEGRQCAVMVFDGVNDGKVDLVECDGAYPYPIWGVLCGHEGLK